MRKHYEVRTIHTDDRVVVKLNDEYGNSLSIYWEDNGEIEAKWFPVDDSNRMEIFRGRYMHGDLDIGVEEWWNGG